MRTVALVHGAWHGAWCWAPVLAGLDELGIDAVAVDLPGPDLHADADHVTAVLDGLDTSVVLVGHSYGGAVITDAGVHPAVDRLVYVAAFAPDEDETVLGLAFDHGENAELAGAVVVGDDGTSVLDLDRVGDVLYGDCAPADVDRAKALLRPQPMATGLQPPRAVAWRDTPATYLVCGADRAIAGTQQRAMAERIPGVAIVEWPDSSHSPFFSRPGEVVDVLAGLA